MTVAQISALLLAQIDDNPANPASVAPGGASPYTTPPEILAAINHGQQLASLLTLCIEKTASFPLDGSTWYLPRPTLTDFIVPLRFTVGGVRLRPATLASLEAENTAWQATPGTAARYAALGFNLLAVTPQQTATASMLYAASAPALVLDSDVPVLPEAYHRNLIDFGVYLVRLKEGAQGLERGLKRLNLYLDDMTRLGDWVRARSIAARYDVLPFELALFDRSRLIGKMLGTTGR